MRVHPSQMIVTDNVRITRDFPWCEVKVNNRSMLFWWDNTNKERTLKARDNAGNEHRVAISATGRAAILNPNHIIGYVFTAGDWVTEWTEPVTEH